MKDVELKAALFDAQQEINQTNGALQALVAANLTALGLNKVESLEELIKLIEGTVETIESK